MEAMQINGHAPAVVSPLKVRKPRARARKKAANPIVTIKVDKRALDRASAQQAAQQAARAEQSRMFGLLDAVSQAKTALKGTVNVMSLIIDADREYEEGVPATLERWIKADMAALDRAFDAAWDGILGRQPEGD
jgi:hypothetical protein